MPAMIDRLPSLATYRALLSAARNARSAMDEVLGDTDLEGDDSPLFVACHELSKVLNRIDDAAAAKSTP